jgi:hypothetical protein
MAKFVLKPNVSKAGSASVFSCSKEFIRYAFKVSPANQNISIYETHLVAPSPHLKKEAELPSERLF